MQFAPLTQQGLFQQHNDNDLIRTRVFPLVGSSTHVGYNPIIPHCCKSEATENVTMVRELPPLYMYTRSSQLADNAPSFGMNGMTNNTVYNAAHEDEEMSDLFLDENAERIQDLMSGLTL